MALPTDTIKLTEIAAEFEDAPPHALTEFYGAADGVPTSGAISLAADFRGKSASAPKEASVTTTVAWQVIG